LLHTNRERKTNVSRHIKIESTGSTFTSAKGLVAAYNFETYAKDGFCLILVPLPIMGN